MVATGQLPPRRNRPVRLERWSGTGWLVVAHGQTVSGAFRFEFAARTTNTRYRVLAPQVRIGGRRYSAVVTPVRTVTVVAQSASLALPASALAGTNVTATATFTPARPSRQVRIQRLDGSTWVNVSTGVQDASGRLTVAVPVGAEPGNRQFRARADYWHGAPSSTSAARSVTVTAPRDTTPPDPVTDVEVWDVSRTTVDLAWTEPWDDDDFEGVMIRRRLGTTPPGPAGGELVANVDAFVSSYTDTGLTPDTTYTYALFAHDEVPNYAAAATARARTLPPPDTTPPGPVTGLTTTEISWDHVSLAWTNPIDSDLDGVMIRRRLGTTPPGRAGGELVADLDPTATSYADYDVDPQSTYAYAVFAYDEVPNYSAPASTIATTTEHDVEPPGSVSEVRTSGVTMTSVVLGWTNPTDADFAGVTIRRATGPIPPSDPSQGTLVIDTDAGATSYVDTGLVSGRTYSYALFAHDEVPLHAAAAVVTVVTETDTPATTGSWPQYRQGPEHRGWSPNETIIRPPNVGGLAEEWNTTEHGIPVIDGSTMFVSASDDTGEAVLSAYDLETGSTGWRKRTNSCVGQPALAPTMVVIGCGTVQAYLRGGTHAKVWDTAETDPGQSFYDILVIDQTVVARGADRVVAYRMSDGQRVWQQLLPSGSSSVIDVAASGDRVVVAYGNRLRALSLATGAQLWSQPVVSNDVLIADGWVYTQGNGSVRRYALTDGTAGWSVSPEFGVYRLLAADNNTVYVWSAVFDFGPPSPSILRALRVTDGALKWSVDVPSRIGAVGITGSLVWLTSSDIYSQGRSSDLIALHRSDGALLKQVHFDDNMYGSGSVAFGGGKVVLEQGGSSGGPEPHRLRVYGIAGVRPTITTSALPLARVGSTYSHQLTTADASGPIAWSVVAGTLPSGLTLSSAGVLSGTPTTTGLRQVTLRATGANGRSNQQSFPIQVVRAVSSTNWQSGGMSGARNPFSPGTGALDITEAPSFGLRWKTAAGTDPSGYPPNVVIQGTEFYTVAGDGRLKAYSITGSTANRSPLWTVGAGGANAFVGAVVLGDGVLLVRDRDTGRLWAVRAADGVKLWWTAAGVANPYVAPLIVGETVVVTRWDGMLDALSLTDGAPRWDGTLTTRDGWGELSTDGTRIYGVSRCVLYALDATNGAELWDTPTLTPDDSCSDQVYPQTAPIVAGNRVYAAEPFSKLVADAATGEVVDRFRVYGLGSGGGVVVGGVWIYHEDGYILARDPTTGRRLWLTPTPVSYASVVATGDLVIVTGPGGIAGLDRLTGELVWDGGTVDGTSGGHREGLAIGMDRILIPTSTGVAAYGPL